MRQKKQINHSRNESLKYSIENYSTYCSVLGITSVNLDLCESFLVPPSITFKCSPKSHCQNRILFLRFKDLEESNHQNFAAREENIEFLTKFRKNSIYSISNFNLNN